MKTPFTPFFKRADTPLTRVSRCPFAPNHPLPFVADDATVHYVGDGCQLSYRWHDAFDVFVAVLEARFAPVDGSRLEIPIESHLYDLHLVYQLTGSSNFMPLASSQTRPVLSLPARHHMQVYAPPGSGVIHILPDGQTLHFALAVVVPKGDWVTRYPAVGNSPMEELIRSRKEMAHEYRYLGPTPSTESVLFWINRLLNTPPRSGMSLDDALNGPMVRLIKEHSDELADRHRARQLVATVRLWVADYVSGMDGSQPPPSAELSAQVFATTPRRIRELHRKFHAQKFAQFISYCRVEEAKQRLRAGESIAAVALKLGWADVPTFSKHFKKSTGQTPGHFIKETAHK